MIINCSSTKFTAAKRSWRERKPPETPSRQQGAESAAVVLVALRGGPRRAARHRSRNLTPGPALADRRRRSGRIPDLGPAGVGPHGLLRRAAARCGGMLLLLRAARFAQGPVRKIFVELFGVPAAGVRVSADSRSGRQSEWLARLCARACVCVLERPLGAGVAARPEPSLRGKPQPDSSARRAGCHAAHTPRGSATRLAPAARAVHPRGAGGGPVRWPAVWRRGRSCGPTPRPSARGSGGARPEPASHAVQPFRCLSPRLSSRAPCLADSRAFPGGRGFAAAACGPARRFSC